MQDIRYYLDHARHSARPINIALIGDRAAGKTSIMNVIEIEARQRGCCTVRVNLDESDADNALVFFFKIFDSILHQALEEGAFGGFSGGTYQTYMGMLAGCPQTPETLLFLTFLFPVHYANCVKTNIFNAPVSDSAIGHDFGLIASEVKKPIVIFFDESNVLAKSRILLEKLRNTFMNLTGYMLVLAGTPDMFPLMDDVFSPIIRQFKKIEIGAFTEIEDTVECVRKPLFDANIDVRVGVQTVKEIHELSGGRPYEIQLICHLLFRRLQNTQSRLMQLDFRALEDLRKELAQSQSFNARPIMSQMASLSQLDLEGLRVLTRCNSHATLETLDHLCYLFPGKRKISSAELRRAFENLLGRQIIAQVDGVIAFEGDYFDRLYAKYFAREQAVLLNLDPTSVIQALSSELRLFLSPFVGSARRVNLDFAVQLQSFSASLLEKDAEIGALLSSGPALLDEFYFKQVEMQGHKSFNVSTFVLRFHDNVLALAAEPQVDWSAQQTEELDEACRGLAERAATLGGELTRDIIEVEVVPLDRLKESVVNSQDARIREMLSREHLMRAMQLHNDGMKEAAVTNALLSSQYFDLKDFSQRNNCGYVLMAGGRWSEASGLIHRSEELAMNTQDKMLAKYNLAVLQLHDGDHEGALSSICAAEELTSSLGSDPKWLKCLLRPVWLQNELAFEEIMQPAVDSALREFKSFLLTPSSDGIAPQ